MRKGIRDNCPACDDFWGFRTSEAWIAHVNLCSKTSTGLVKGRVSIPERSKELFFLKSGEDAKLADVSAGTTVVERSATGKIALWRMADYSKMGWNRALMKKHAGKHN